VSAKRTTPLGGIYSPTALLYSLSPKILSNDQSRGPTKGSIDQSALRSRFIVNSISPPGSSARIRPPSCTLPPASDRGTPLPSDELAPAAE
jgi:hypothetical protein